MKIHGKSSKHKHDCLESQDQRSEPHALPLKLLKKITNNFSDERLLGKGGSGFVYKGVKKSGEIIAVKKLVPSMVGAQSLFENEIHHLMRLKHPNIVRFRGYCYETQKVIIEYRGKHVFAERSEMLLCLEYLPKGSLDGYISDGSSQLDWHTSYKIIEGICNGLHYLHEQIDKSVLHLDLKPANILLDDNLAPKITDFGLSRLLDQYQTMFTTNRVGTLGYMAPEYIDEGTVTPKSDIFSLGVIIMELITGHRNYPGFAGASSKGFIELTLKKWRNTLDKAQGYTKLEIDCQQIKRCIQIGLICVNPEWTNRPTTTKIIQMLKGTESSNCRVNNDATSSAYQTSNGVTDEGNPPPPKNTLCIEILEEVERHHPASVSRAIAGDCLRGKLKLLYLKNGECISSQASAVRIAVPGAPAGADLHVDPYMLSVRSPYLRAVFARHNTHYGAAGGGAEGDRMELQEFLDKEVEVEYDALLLVLMYLYSGRVGDLPESAYICADGGGCAHLGCHPTVSFKVQVLFAAFTFQVPELTSLFQTPRLPPMTLLCTITTSSTSLLLPSFQRDLLDVLHKVEVDNLPLILSVANICKISCMKLLERCLEMVVWSNLDMITLAKALAPDVVKKITDLRLNLGLVSSEDMGFPSKHVRRILRALDSDDVELVRMLLKEGQTNLDDAFALHYAVEHCDSKITTELLDIALPDVNLRNPRGYTVLHIAARRRDPKIVVSLLIKGARPSDLTFDGRKAVQISKRLTKHGDYFGNTEEGKPFPNDKLCIEILEQAERRDRQLGEASVSLPLAGAHLRGKLLYLEERVALARLLFPVEARVTMAIGQIDGSLEFTLGSSANPPPWIHLAVIDQNETPFRMKDEHFRLRALSKTVELGKRFFPRCSTVLDKIMDDEPELRDASLERKRRFHDLQDKLLKAFSKDKEEFDRSSGRPMR